MSITPHDHRLEELPSVNEFLGDFAAVTGHLRSLAQIIVDLTMDHLRRINTDDGEVYRLPTTIGDQIVALANVIEEKLGDLEQAVEDGHGTLHRMVEAGR